MFTGIIEEIGKVAAITRGAKSAQLSIAATRVLEDVHLGDSIAVCGICLTVTGFTRTQFTADLMPETLARSSLGALRIGSAVNLERAMSANGRFGGHIVSGHIDGTGSISAIRRDDNATWYSVKTPPALLRYIIEKGSIAIDGVSLTVAAVTKNDFSVSLIPHSAGHTTLSQRRVGDIVNLECDSVGKYIEKLLAPADNKDGGLDRAFLAKYGF